MIVVEQATVGWLHATVSAAMRKVTSEQTLAFHA